MKSQMNPSNINIQIQGIKQKDVIKLQDVLGIEAQSIDTTASHVSRTGTELLSAAFILGVINAAPALIKALADLLSDIRRSRYFTMKVTLDDGKTVIEGAATPERISAMAESLKKLKER